MLVDEPMEVCVALEAEEAIRGCGEATSFLPRALNNCEARILPLAAEPERKSTCQTKK